LRSDWILMPDMLTIEATNRASDSLNHDAIDGKSSLTVGTRNMHQHLIRIDY
jgi:hypothetical protein